MSKRQLVAVLLVSLLLSLGVFAMLTGGSLSLLSRESSAVASNATPSTSPASRSTPIPDRLSADDGPRDAPTSTSTSAATRALPPAVSPTAAHPRATVVTRIADVAGSSTVVAQPSAPGPATSPTSENTNEAPTATVAPVSETPSGPRLERCIVRAGDTLTAIALSRGATIGELAAMNGLEDTNLILSGQELVVPVRPGGSQNPQWCFE